jgi:hypothetical protein
MFADTLYGFTSMLIVFGMHYVKLGKDNICMVCTFEAFRCMIIRSFDKMDQSTTRVSRTSLALLYDGIRM